MPSRYNFSIPVESGTLLYNAKSGAVLRLTGSHANELAAQLSQLGQRVAPEALDPALLTQLLTGEMLVTPERDELLEIRERYRAARSETPLTLTLTTTMDCNLGCYYCYEERSSAALARADIEAVVAIAEQRLRESGRPSLHVDWYGGEPLLNLDWLEAASLALQKLCERLGVRYNASIVSNGTCWPEDAATFLARHQIRQVQISFDGLPGSHGKRRRFRRGRAPSERASSFELAASVVDRLLPHVRVDVRLNLDEHNQAELPAFVAMMAARGWFEHGQRLVFQPARVSAFSERSQFLRPQELAADTFDALRAAARSEVSRHDASGCARVEESEVPNGFPVPRSSVCGALARDSLVVGADGKLFRCGLQVSEPARAVGELRSRSTRATRKRALPVLHPSALSQQAEQAWWDGFDPTTLPKCSRCSFLPICWAGCPKRHLEADDSAIAEQSRYWRNNLPRLVAEGLGERLLDVSALPTSLQFRDCLVG